jgi:signal transduction histidine kinase
MPGSWWSPVRLALLVAWSCLALAALAVVLVLHGILALSERRATFVSAVTHELRTPLTTFRLYTEMLDEGMVPDAGVQREYVRTLRTESDRLGHLVENVLAFARLERGRASGVPETISIAALEGHLFSRLAPRARQAGMELIGESPSVEGRVQVDLSVVEQIVSNLVDNAVKHGSRTLDRRMHLGAAVGGKSLMISVRDHGPGVHGKMTSRLFRAFSKSSDEAAHSVPGVGLGLALSRRLARALGGDLRLVDNGDHGATFALTIPLL